MKKYLLIVFVLFFSCSKDEIAIVESNIPQTNLNINSVQKTYSIQTGEVEYINKFSKNNGSLKGEFYNSENTLLSYDEISLTLQGEFLNGVTYSPDGGVLSSISRTYDSTNRIVGIETINNTYRVDNSISVTITYNNDGSITRKSINRLEGIDDHITSKTYFINAKGAIIKEVEENELVINTVEIKLDAEGDIIESVKSVNQKIDSGINSNNEKVKYTLDNENLTNVRLLSGPNTTTGRNNSILDKGFLMDMANSVNTKFVLKEELYSGDIAGSVISYERTFDNEGRVLTLKKYYNNSFLKSDITYSYE